MTAASAASCRGPATPPTAAARARGTSGATTSPSRGRRRRARRSAPWRRTARGSARRTASAPFKRARRQLPRGRGVFSLLILDEGDVTILSQPQIAYDTTRPKTARSCSTLTSDGRLPTQSVLLKSPWPAAMATGAGPPASAAGVSLLNRPMMPARKRFCWPHHSSPRRGSA